MAGTDLTAILIKDPVDNVMVAVFNDTMFAIDSQYLLWGSLLDETATRRNASRRPIRNKM